MPTLRKREGNEAGDHDDQQHLPGAVVDSRLISHFMQELDNCYYKAAGSSGRDRWRPAMAVYMHIGTKEAGEMINDLIQRVRGRAKNEQNPAVQLYYFFPYIQYIWFGVKFFIILMTTTSISTHLLHPTLYWLGRCTFILLHCMHRSRSRC